MRFGFYLLERSRGHRKLRLLCGDCATKRGLSIEDFVEPPSEHRDCADCGVSEAMSPIWSAERSA